MSIPILEKAVAEVFPIGLTYASPDLDTAETVTSATVAVTPSGLTLSAVTTTTPSVYTTISSGTAGVEYTVLFKVITSGGKTYNNPNKDAILVRVI